MYPYSETDNDYFLLHKKTAVINNICMTDADNKKLMHSILYLLQKF